MTAIESESDLEQYESLFGDVWQSAIVHVSIVQLDNGTEVPNAEIILTDQDLEEREDVLYTKGSFRIVERIINRPFDLLWDLVEGETVVGEDVGIEMKRRRPEMMFRGAGTESRVFGGRPKSEIHTAFTVELSSDQQEEYSEVVDELEFQLPRASEPYYDIAK